MRISDWSSDVCSSDLCRRSRAATALIPCGVGYRQARGISGSLGGGQARVVCATSASPISYGTMFCQWNDGRSAPEQRCRAGDRKSVVWGQSVSVRVYLGGRRIIKKKKKSKETQ